MSSSISWNIPCETMKVAFYGRFSTTMQRRASIDDQLRCVSTRCNMLGGGVLLEDHIYKDEAKTGTNRNRPGLSALLHAAKDPNCPFNYVMFDDPARLGRSTRDVLNVVAELRECGIACYFVAFALDSKDTLFTMTLNLLSTMDELTINRLKEKVHEGQIGRFRAGSTWEASHTATGATVYPIQMRSASRDTDPSSVQSLVSPLQKKRLFIASNKTLQMARA